MMQSEYENDKKKMATLDQEFANSQRSASTAVASLRSNNRPMTALSRLNGPGGRSSNDVMKFTGY